MSETANPHLVHTAQFEAEAARVASLLSTLSAEDWDRPVPTCPGWTVRKAAKHIGSAHRWADAMVRTRQQVNPRSLDLGLPAEDAGLADWIGTGAQALAAEFRATDGDTQLWTWGADPHARFWSRRMLHETSVHRGDIEMALGRIPEYDRAVAVDGVDEFLENLPSAAYFAPKVRQLTGDGETLHLHATDTDADTGTGTRTGTGTGTDAHADGKSKPAACNGNAEWLITLEPKGFRWSRAHAKGAAAVRGTTSNLYLFAWGRRRPDSEQVEVLGDHTLLDHWVQNAAF